MARLSSLPALLLTCCWLPLLFTSFTHAFPTPENIAKLAQRAGVVNNDGHPSTFHELHLELLKIRNESELLGRSNVKAAIDVSGPHAFVPPSDGDQRGPCPGLNMLANHNYIPHDGVVGLLELITAANSIFSIGVDFGTLLGALGTIFAGNPLSLNPGFSIGGQTPKVSNLLGDLGGLLDPPRGLDYSHNLVEADGSPTRDDLYVTGDCWTMNLDAFTQLYNMIEGDYLTRDLAGEWAVIRYHWCIHKNPNCYYGPFTGYLGRTAGYVIFNSLFANHTDDNPNEDLHKDILKSMYGVQEDPSTGALSYKPGWERIPANWHPRPTPLGLIDYNVVVLEMLVSHPELLSIGGNTGTVDSFVGLDISDLSGGVLNAAKLLEGNNLMCFVLEVVKTVAPNYMGTLFRTLAAPLQLLDGAVLGPLLDLACPAFEDMEMNGKDLFAGLLDKYPGAKKAGSAM